jgi:hypothetical protein
MVCPSSRRATALIVAVACLMAIARIAAKAQPSDDLETLNQPVQELYKARRYEEATAIANRALAPAERQFGPDHPAVGKVLDELVVLYRAENRYDYVVPLMTRALAIAEKALGRRPAHDLTSVVSTIG